MNKWTVYEWIKKVIDSVENNQQDMTSERLIDNFQLMFGDYTLTRELMSYSYLHLTNWNK